MGYRPAFDASTVYYADSAAQWLANREHGSQMTGYLALLSRLHMWATEHPTDVPAQFFEVMGTLNGAKKTGPGTFDIEGMESGWSSPGGRLVRLLFGLLSLSRVVESICLGDELHYFPLAGYQFSQVCPFLSQFDRHASSGSIWVDSRLEGEKPAARFERWIRRGPISEAAVKTALSQMAERSLPHPYIALAAHLYDTSAGGAGKPMPAECDCEIRVEGNIHDLDKLVPTSILVPTDNMLGVLNRFRGYLVNAVVYDVVASSLGIHYVPNDIRGPFLYAVKSCQTPSDRDYMIRALEKAIGVSRPHPGEQALAEGPEEHEKVSVGHAAFGLVLAEARDATDIVPAAYRLRQVFAPFRDHISRIGWTAGTERQFQRFLRRLAVERKVEEEGLGLPIKGLTARISGDRVAWLFKPYYTGRRRLFNSIRVCVDNYRFMYSMSDRLRRLVELVPSRSRALVTLGTRVREW